MSEHLTTSQIALQELDDAGRSHVRGCARCANALLEELELKRAIAAAGRAFRPPDALRARIRRDLERRRARIWPLVAAAAIVVLVISAIALAPRRDHELVDLHVTLLASANPVDVVSTDRHTVKPWFEGRLPFSLTFPELANTPFRLLGGRVVYWHQQPAAYLLLGKGAHRLSLFVLRGDTPPLLEGRSGFHTRTWREGGLVYVAVSDLSDDDLQTLERIWGGRS
jgi:anti-sigma factor RsiW